MKSVLISIQPKWCEKIANGEKTVELRKTRPKLETPFKCYIYCTKPKFPHEDHITLFDKQRCFYAGGKVIGEFICDAILSHCEMANADIAEVTSLVRREKIREYAGEKEVFGWHISDLVIYDEPKDWDYFRKPANCWPQPGTIKCYGCHDCEIKRPPRSWCYVEG